MVDAAVWRIVTPVEQRRKAERAHDDAVAEVEGYLDASDVKPSRAPSAERAQTFAAAGADMLGEVAGADR